MNLLRLLTVKTLSLSLILGPMTGTARAGEVERSPLYYKVKRGDALSEVLDHLLLRPIYPVTGSLRRTIAANPGRFTDLKAPVFAGEKIYFAMSDEIMLRQNNEVLASGEVHIGRRPTEERLTKVLPAPPLAKAQPKIEPKPELLVPVAASQTEISPEAPRESKKPPTDVALLPSVQPLAQRQEPQLVPDRDPEDMPAQTTEPSQVVKSSAPQTFPAKEDEGGVIKDAFVIKHSGGQSAPPSAAYQPAPPLYIAEPQKPSRRPASQTTDEPLEQDNYFPMGDSPVAAPRASDTKAYQSEF